MIVCPSWSRDEPEKLNSARVEQRRKEHSCFYQQVVSGSESTAPLQVLCKSSDYTFAMTTNSLCLCVFLIMFYEYNPNSLSPSRFIISYSMGGDLENSQAGELFSDRRLNILTLGFSPISFRALPVIAPCHSWPVHYIA